MLLPLLTSAQAANDAPFWQFVDATDGAGLTSTHAYAALPLSEPQKVAGGVATGDFDGDGNIDLYVVAGDAGRNLLFHNLGDGTFADVGQSAGVAIAGRSGSGPLFFDFDGDGRVDLFVGAVQGDSPALFHNEGDGTFTDATASSGLVFPSTTVSATAGDYNGDGWLDLFLTHWGSPNGSCHLWRNNGGTGFTCADSDAGLDGVSHDPTDWTFTANFVDLDKDGLSDLLVTTDFGGSSVWHNQGDGRFANATTFVISDENGMGSAVADYDGDGNLDWFVSSIRDADGTTEGNWGTTGNRLYRNLGGGKSGVKSGGKSGGTFGTFNDVTDAAGVRDGAWGWGASFADFNNDGLIDLVQVDGWPQGSPQFRGTPARLFIAGPAGRFEDQAARLGLSERVGGRGVVCFDYDRDGDLDIFVANNNGPYHLWRNDGGRAGGHFLTVAVMGKAPNVLAVGAKVFLSAGGHQQQRDLRAGSNYVSQNPLEAHFGLGAISHVDRIRVVWPDGGQAVIDDVEVDRHLVVNPGNASARLTGGGCSAD